MKKIITAIFIILSLLLSSCDFITDEKNDTEQSSSLPGGETNEGGGGNGSGDGDGSSLPDGSGTNEECRHTDGDDDGFCDGCTADVTVEINFFVINDFHGKMSDSDTQPGADELSLYLKNLSSAHQNSILLSSGDMWQGGAESNLSHGLIVTEWMNELDFAAMTLGNHEYDWGEKYIEENAELAEFPLLAINIYSRKTNERVEYCEPSVMIERGGVQIGIIGAIGDCYSSISADKCADVYFKTDYALTSLVKAESERLRALGADYIVYSIHDGYGSSSSASTISDSKLSSYYDTSLSSGGYVDVVFEGHSHKTYALRDSFGVYHLQGGGDNDGFVHFSVDVNLAGGSDKTKAAKIISNSVYGALEDDPYIDTLYEKYSELIAKMYEVLGQNPSYIDDSVIESCVAELYRELGEDFWGETYDIFLGGGYLKTRSPYNLYAGEVTYGDVMMVLPFDNQIVLCSIKGSALKQRFLSGISDYYVSLSEYGESIKNSIDDNATYYIIVDTYTAYYSPNGLTIVAQYDDTTFARDLLAEYIKAGNMW